MPNLASYIDHTALKPDTSLQTIERLCKEAVENNFASVCVNPHYVQPIVQMLQNSSVKACTVSGFPLGASLSDVKLYETEKVLEFGAQEVDTVINVAAVIAEDWNLIHNEISGLSGACHKSGAILKVILETCLLNRGQIVNACKVAVAAGADFVKTSTGFSTMGAQPEIVSLMKETVGNEALVKASGGIRTYHDAVVMVEAGADRIGSSAGVKLLKPE
jgi:deoxyribose-phosphate aldolase